MLPYGKKDRPIYPTASLSASSQRAKEKCGLIPFDFPGTGLWSCPYRRSCTQAAESVSSWAERSSAGL